MKRFFRHLWRVVCLAMLLMAATLSLISIPRAHAASNTITADFGVGVDNPLLKTKFNLFNTFKRTPADFQRDAALLSELSAETMRADFELGTSYGQDAHAVSGTASNLTYDFSLIDQEAQLMLQHGVMPYWDYTYAPFPLQTGGNPSNQPSPLSGWQQMTQAFASHFKTSNLPAAVQEVWNEPDGVFYTGTVSDYEALYAASVAGLRAGDPDAVLGGPTIAYNTSFNSSFLQYLNAHNLPLNVETFHSYGSGGWTGETSTLASQLSSYPAFNTTAMSMDEYNSYPCCNFPVGGTQDHYGAAALLLHDFDQMLNVPALTSVSWAQFQDECAPGPGCYDPSIGLVTYDGHRKASFNAFKIYSRMPVDRNQVTITGASQEAMASSSSHRASLVAFNRTGSDQSTTVTLKNVPFATGTVTVYRIDASHASYFDNSASENLTPTETYTNVNTANWTWTGTIPNNGTVYFEVNDGSGLSGLEPNPVAKVINVNHYYPSRTTSSSSDFDPRTWTARQGTGNNQSADQEVGVTAEQLPSVLTFSPTIQGSLAQIDQNSCACIRIDYQVNGAYTKGVLFHGPYNGGTDLYNSARSAPMPFGTKRQADQVVQVPNLANFQVNLSQYAPSGWSGRAQITFIFENAGSNTRWIVPVHAGSSTPPNSVAINAGGPAAGSFAADTDYSGGNINSTTANINTSGVSNPAPQAVYQTERYGNFTYTIPNLKPGGQYTVRLHEAEIYWTSSGQRTFNVSINGQQVLTNFDIYAAAGGADKAVVEQFTVTADSSGQITLQFTSVKDNAKVDGIEILASSGGTPTPTPTPSPTATPASTPTPTPSPTSGTGGSSCSVQYAVTNQWQGGFGASVTINNTGSATINGWTLTWSFADGQTITQLWNGSYTQSGSSVSVTNVSYNGTIASGGTANFGFNGSWSNSNAAPTSFALNGKTCAAA